jgi:hypothetical protein
MQIKLISYKEIKKFRFSIADLEQTARKAHQEGLASPVLHIQPHIMPDFLSNT